jgi:DnaK suppressor protein
MNAPMTGGEAEVSRAVSLDEEFLARQKQRLQATRDTLLRGLAGVSEEEREWAEGAQEALRDWEERGPYVSARDLDAALQRKLRRRLAIVERALQKIEEGTYGLCDETGEPIPRGRLEAVPEAIYTIEVQKRRENRS